MRKVAVITPILALAGLFILSGCQHAETVTAANKAQVDGAAQILALRESNKKPIAEVVTTIPDGFVNNSGEDITTTVTVWPDDELMYRDALALANYEIFDPLWLRTMDRLVAPVTGITFYWLGRDYDYRNNQLAYGQRRYESERQWNFMDGTLGLGEEALAEGEAPGLEPAPVTE